MHIVKEVEEAGYFKENGHENIIGKNYVRVPS
jgi:hypothetical protein